MSEEASRITGQLVLLPSTQSQIWPVTVHTCEGDPANNGIKTGVAASLALTFYETYGEHHYWFCQRCRFVHIHSMTTLLQNTLNRDTILARNPVGDAAFPIMTSFSECCKRANLDVQSLKERMHDAGIS